MKLIDRYTFANGKAFETYYLNAADTNELQVPECDVIALRSTDEDGKVLRFTMMRPDEALIMSRLLVGAVLEVSEGYTVGPPKGPQQDLDCLYPKYNCPNCDDWFHMPWKFCKCQQNSSVTLDSKAVNDGPV